MCASALFQHLEPKSKSHELEKRTSRNDTSRHMEVRIWSVRPTRYDLKSLVGASCAIWLWSPTAHLPRDQACNLRSLGHKRLFDIQLHPLLTSADMCPRSLLAVSRSLALQMVVPLPRQINHAMSDHPDTHITDNCKRTPQLQAQHHTTHL